MDTKGATDHLGKQLNLPYENNAVILVSIALTVLLERLGGYAEFTKEEYEAINAKYAPMGIPGAIVTIEGDKVYVSFQANKIPA